LNYAAYAKCQLSRGDKGDTRVAHISVEISNDTLRVLRNGAAQERRNVTVSRVRVRGVTLRATPDICIIFMQPRRPGGSRRGAASLLLFPTSSQELREKKERKKRKSEEG